MKTNCVWSLRALLVLASVTGARVAGAQEAAPAADSGATAASCEASYEKAQTERLAGHYISASASALACSQIQCNQAIVRECLRLYESLEQDTPTLVFSARKAEGGALIDVKVEMDGKPIADRITGRPMPVDPGPHQFVFIDPTRGRLETTESARVGDHARVIEVTFADPNAKAALAAAPAGAAPDRGAAPQQHPRGVPVMTWVLGGVGVVGLATFVALRVDAVGDYNHYNATCAPECDPAKIDPVRTKFTLSYVSLGVGAAASAGAVLVYVLGRSGDQSPSAEARIEPVAGGAVARLRTTF